MLIEQNYCCKKAGVTESAFSDTFTELLQAFPTCRNSVQQDECLVCSASAYLVY